MELLLGHWEDWERLPLPLLSQSWIKEPMALLPEPSPASLRRAVRTWFCFLFFLFFFVVSNDLTILCSSHSPSSAPSFQKNAHPERIQKASWCKTPRSLPRASHLLPSARLLLRASELASPAGSSSPPLRAPAALSHAVFSHGGGEGKETRGWFIWGSWRCQPEAVSKQLAHCGTQRAGDTAFLMPAWARRGRAARARG